MSQRLDSIRAGEPALPFAPHDPDAWRIAGALQRALSGRPEDRFPDMASFASALQTGGAATPTVRIARLEPIDDGIGGSGHRTRELAPGDGIGQASESSQAGRGRLPIAAFAVALTLAAALGWTWWPTGGTLPIAPPTIPPTSEAPPGHPVLPMAEVLATELSELAPGLVDDSQVPTREGIDLADVLGHPALEAALPTLPRLRDRLAASLGPDGLDAEVRSRLSNLDQAFESHGLEPPFDPWLARPSGKPVDLPSRVRAVAEAADWFGEVVPERAEGWAATAVAALEGSLEIRASLEDDLVSGETIDALPPLLGSLRPLVRFSTMPLAKVTSGIVRVPADRVALSRWLRPATLAFRRAVLAASLAADDPQQAYAVLLVCVKPSTGGPLMFSQALFGPEEAWSGRGPDSQARDLLRGLVLLRTADILRNWTEPHKDRYQSGVARLARVARDPGATPLARRLRYAALMELVSGRADLVGSDLLRSVLLPLPDLANRLHPADEARLLVASLHHRTALVALGPDAAAALERIRGLDPRTLPAWFPDARRELEEDLAKGEIVLPDTGRD